MPDDSDSGSNPPAIAIPEAHATIQGDSAITNGPSRPALQILRAAEAASAYTPFPALSALPQVASAGTIIPLHELPSFQMESDSTRPELIPLTISQFAMNSANIGTVSEDAIPANIVNDANLDMVPKAQLNNLQQLQHAATVMTSNSIQHASMSVASNLVTQSGNGSSVPSNTNNNNDEHGIKAGQPVLLACRLPQPPDGRWLGCGQAAHAPIPCYAWQQMGLTHSNQIHDRVFTFTSSHLSASSMPMNRMCAMRQPPFPDQNGPLKQGCGQLAHPDSVCATWIAAGVLTVPDVRQRLLEWKKKFPNAGIARNEYGSNNKIVRKMPDKDRCVIPQPPDGVVRGCLAGNQHHGSVCESWKTQGVNKFEEIRPALCAWYQEHPNPALELCDFVQPPDGILRGCGAPSHKGRICASWAEVDVLTRQEAIKKVRAFRAQTKPRKSSSTIRPDAEKLCNLSQPPDGRVIGCGEPFHRMAVCSSWLAFGVPTRDLVKAYVDKYREDAGTTANFTRICRALQPPDGRVKGCGLGWHRGVCPSWQELNITDRKTMTEYIQANIESIVASGPKPNRKRISYAGVSRVTEFPDFANDPDLSLRYLLEGDFDRSVQELTKRIRKFPDNASFYNNRGIAYAERGWSDLAIRDCFKAIELDPTYSDAFANRGIIRLSLNKPLLAGDDCKKALSFPGGHSPHLVRFAYAMTLYESGDFNKCLYECESILNDNRSLAQAKVLSGLANGALQKYELAIRFFESALESGFDKDRVSVLLDIARKKLSNCESSPTSQRITGTKQPTETDGSSLLQDDHGDDDLAGLSDSGTESIEMEMDDDDDEDHYHLIPDQDGDSNEEEHEGDPESDNDDVTLSDDNTDP